MFRKMIEFLNSLRRKLLRPVAFVVAVLVLLALATLADLLMTTVVDDHRGPDAHGDVALSATGFEDALTSAPEYLDQGWRPRDSQWFYNTTQGSDLLPYAFLLALERSTKDRGPVACDRGGETAAWFLCDAHVDAYRYLPQAASDWNPDALPVGFTRDTYQGKAYVGYTCAACHTGQVNYKGRALRIDGGAAMADMDGFLRAMTEALLETVPTADGGRDRFDRFADRVMKLDDGFASTVEVETALRRWTDERVLYNEVNYSLEEFAPGRYRALKYGYGRLDAFGRIFNRINQHLVNKAQLARRLANATRDGAPLLTGAEIDRVLDFIPDDNLILATDQFIEVSRNLRSADPGYPGLSLNEMVEVQRQLFNSPNAPVSYPFLWDITHADYVQWNALGNNATLGPLGRNTGEVLGVFASIDWKQDDSVWTRLLTFSLSSYLSGQGTKKHAVSFDSSADKRNLQRIETRLTTLLSPRWPFCRDPKQHPATADYYLPTEPAGEPVDLRPCRDGDIRIDHELARAGREIYVTKCQGCHVVIERDAWDRVMVSQMLGIDHPQSTDPAMAENSVRYTGPSGNFAGTYQSTTVGDVVVAEEAPVVQGLTGAVRGVIATGDPDKSWLRGAVEWGYTLYKSLRDNPVKASVKAGNYTPDSTADPYASLRAYRGRSLNGVWATGPFLHNGSVPTLHDLLLPAKAKPIPGDPEGRLCDETRPARFRVGSREFDPAKVGFLSEGYTEGFEFRTDRRGNLNTGHEYGACGMTDDQRWALIEYLKSL